MRHTLYWQHAFDTARRMYLHVRPPVGEISADWVLYAEWPSIVTCFNGIEMVMKVLLDHQGRCGRDQWQQVLGHDLAKAWSRLDQETRDHVEYHYAQHRSLHYHPDPSFASATAGAFIGHINGDKNSGSIAWRYAPVMDYDGSVPPPLLAWTMFEVWNSLICHLRLTAASDEGGWWCSCLVSRMMIDGGPLALAASDLSRGADPPVDDRLDCEARTELSRWLRGTDISAETTLTNTIRCLAAHVRDAWHEIDLQEPLIERLKTQTDATMRQMRESKDPDLNQLWHRLMLSNGRLQFGKAEDPDDPRPRFEFSAQLPYVSRFAVCEDGDTRCQVKACDLLVGDAVGLPALGQLSLEPRHTPTGAALSVSGCAFEEIRLDAPSRYPSAFGIETVWQVDAVTAHMCENRVIGERTISLSDSVGAKLTVRLGDDQLVCITDEADDASRRDYRLIVDLPDAQSDPNVVLGVLRQAGYTALLNNDHRLTLKFREAARRYDWYLRNRRWQPVCVLFSHAGTLTDITDTHIREIHRLIESRLYEPEQESLRIENRYGDSVIVLADRQVRSASTVSTQARLVGIMVRQPPDNRSAAE